MAVLFDSFSYRIKEVESGICYDRWHFGKYPELTMPEHLFESSYKLFANT